MRQPLTCMRCGHEGPDVLVKTVDLEAEARAEGRRVRRVEVQLVRELRHVKEITKVEADELYGTEYRCRDRWACEERYRAQEQAGQPAIEEDVPWL